MATADLTAARLRELLEYDPETGLFRWRAPRSRFQASPLAGTKQRIGYIVFRVDGTLQYAHRLAWLYMTGSWPQHKIDHIDGQKGNNRWPNLRDVPQAVNCQNQRQGRKGGPMMGAYYDHRCDRWKSSIAVDKKQIHLGNYATELEAHNAYLAAKRELHVGCTI